MTNPTLKVGDRVRGVHTKRLGSVQSLDTHTARVVWDNGDYLRDIYLHRLEKIMPPIDPTKPLLLFSANSCGSAARTVTLIARTDTGHLIVDMKDNGLGSDFRWLVFDAEGRPVRSNFGEVGATGHGSSLRIKNSPVIETAYVRVSGALKGECSLHPVPPGGTGVAVVELKIEDGIVVGVALHRSNEQPNKITAKQL